MMNADTERAAIIAAALRVADSFDKLKDGALSVRDRQIISIAFRNFAKDIQVGNHHNKGQG